MKEEGGTILSLLPIYPISEFTRDDADGKSLAVTDHFGVNPKFGSEDDFRLLVQTAHRKGLKIIIRLIAPFAAWDSRLLMEHPDWFVHNETGAIVSPNAELSDVAQLDYSRHEPQKYMIAVMKYWLEAYDIDGFECVYSNYIPLRFWKIVRHELDKVKPVMMITDEAEPACHRHAFDLSPSWNINAVLKNTSAAGGFSKILDDSLNAEVHQYPKGSLFIRDVVLHHDVSFRSLDDVQKKDLEMVIAFTLPGIPRIVYRQNRNINRASQSKGRMARHLPRVFQQQLSSVRRAHQALRSGSCVHLPDETDDVYSFLRILNSDTILVRINNGARSRTVELKAAGSISNDWIELISGRHIRVDDGTFRQSLPPMSAWILTPRNEGEKQ